MALIHEIRAGQVQSNEGSEGSTNPTDVFLLSMSRQNFQAVLNAVFKMEQYWAGVTNVSQLLEKRESQTQTQLAAPPDFRQAQEFHDPSLVNSRALLSLCLIKGSCVDSAQIPLIHNIHPRKRVCANQ